MVKKYSSQNNNVEQKKEESSFISLNDYINNIGRVVSTYCGYPQWVKCDIVKINKNGGHYYLEIADTDNEGKKIKSQTAIIFSSKSYSIFSKFFTKTRMQISAGMNVLFQLKVSFSANFGISFVIEDVDPNYTVGAIEVKNNQIREEIFSRGWNELNRKKILPLHYKRVAVLSPNKAAGLGDFKSEADRMEHYGICSFDYFDAKFEGDSVVGSITSKMKEIYDSGIEKYDVLVFIRGGGSVSSLQSLNEFKIASYVAKYPIPVITGIGHERDKVIIDEYSRLSLDTPSKVAELIFNTNTQNIINLKNDIDEILTGALNHFENEIINIDNSLDYIYQGGLNYLESIKNKIEVDVDSIYNHTIEKLENQINNIDYTVDSVAERGILFLETSLQSVISDEDIIYSKSIDVLTQNISQIDNDIEAIKSHSYDNSLNKGFAIIRQENKILTSKEDFSYDKEINIQFKDGYITLKSGENK